MIYPGQTSVHVITHSDLDGMAAAAVVKQQHPDASVIITNYKKPIRLNKFKAGDTVYVTDFSLSKEVFEEIQRKGIRIIWIDHHESAIQTLTSQGWDCEGIRRTDYSGAALTWLYFNPDKTFDQAPDVIKLVNWWDLWQHDKDPRVRKFNYGSGLWDLRPGYVAGDKFWSDIFTVGKGDKILANAVKHGDTIQKYSERLQDVICEDLAYKTKIMTTSGNYKNAMTMLIRPGNSSVFERMDLSGIDVTLTCQYYAGSTKQYRCSCYSPDNNKEILDVAQQFGGGGHPTAAGFTVPVLPVDLPIRTTPKPLEQAVATYDGIYRQRLSSLILMKYANKSNGITAKICGWHTIIHGIKCIAFNYYYLPEMIPVLPVSLEVMDDEGNIPDIYVGYVMTNSGYYRCCAYPTSTSVDMERIKKTLNDNFAVLRGEGEGIKMINGGLWWYASETPVQVPINLTIPSSTGA